jgi:hypothetical protein
MTRRPVPNSAASEASTPTRQIELKKNSVRLQRIWSQYSGVRNLLLTNHDNFSDTEAPEDI